MMFTKYVRGMVYWGDLPRYDRNPNVMAGKRPVIIVSNNVANCLSNNITIIPCTTNTEKRPNQPTHTILNLSPETPSMVLAEDIMTINKDLLTGFMGMLDEITMQKIDECIKAALGLIEIPNPMLTNPDTRAETRAEPKKKKLGRRVSGTQAMHEFLMYVQQNGIEKTQEEYGVPTPSAVQQRINSYKKELKLNEPN